MFLTPAIQKYAIKANAAAYMKIIHHDIHHGLMITISSVRS